jgi:multidrug efflux system membrane fusion protein
VTGIKESDLVITGNLQKIGPGAPVQPLPPAQAQSDANGSKEAHEF